MTQWRSDVLGDEFECTDIDLGEDSEGPLVATLVRALPTPLGFWDRTLGRVRDLEHLDVLYVHGWSDYFFQKDLARYFTSRGARFFALDLRKYGRSLRQGQTFGYTERLEDYDTEIDAAIDIMRNDNTGGSRGGGAMATATTPNHRSLVLLGHSTGGLVLSLWADRHRGVADALVLNSPWLELQVSGAARRAIAPMLNLHARYSPHEITLPQLDLGFYTQAQRASDPDGVVAAVNPAWRPDHAMPVRAGWLKAIVAGHERIAAGIDVGMPVCMLLSARSEFGLSWNDAMLRADTVLDVDAVARAGLRLGPSVTIERINGALHDVFLSEAKVREEAYQRMDRWLLGKRPFERALDTHHSPSR